MNDKHKSPSEWQWQANLDRTNYDKMSRTSAAAANFEMKIFQIAILFHKEKYSLRKLTVL